MSDKKRNTTDEFEFSNTINGCDTILFGIPFDGTACYRPGTRFGPEAVRNAFYSVESYSPYQDKDLLGLNIYDAGDSTIVYGDTKRTLDNAAALAAPYIEQGLKTVMIGGEHLVSLPIIETYVKKYPDLVVIQCDAHADLRDDFMDEKLSHACVMKRVWDIVGDERLFQFGIRSGTKDEFLFAQEHTMMQRFDLSELRAALVAIGDKPVYLTIDLDVLDPSEMPGTGTPEAGGVSFRALMDAIELLKSSHIVGADIVELSPPIDPSGISTSAACKLLREILLVMNR